MAGLPRYPVTARVDPAILSRLRYAGRYSRVEQMDPPAADGWVKVSMRFEVEEDACECLLGFGPQTEVLEPLELREKVIHLAERVVALYAQKS